MVRAVNPWLRSLLRAGKKQQRSAARVVKALLAAPKPKPKPKPKPEPKLKARPAAPKTATPASAAKVRAGRAQPAPIEAVAPATGKWLASHYTGLGEKNAVRRMSYWLYLPERAPGLASAGAGLPLVVMLHGCDQSATLFAQGTRMNQLAAKEGYAVVYPQQSVTAHPRRCWKWYDRATQHGGGDVGLIVGIVNKVAAQYAIDRSRIYICGISAGAGMAHIVAINHPELFAGVGLHSGPIYGAGHSPVGALAVMQHGAVHRIDSAIAEVLEKRPGFPPMPTLLIQGEGDTVVRPINQAHLEKQAMLLNQLPGPVDVVFKAGGKRSHAYQLRDVYRGRKLMLRVARIAELKHAWSGGDERLSYHSAAGPDASKMLLNFFSRHRRLAA